MSCTLLNYLHPAIILELLPDWSVDRLEVSRDSIVKTNQRKRTDLIMLLFFNMDKHGKENV